MSGYSSKARAQYKVSRITTWQQLSRVKVAVDEKFKVTWESRGVVFERFFSSSVKAGEFISEEL